MIRRLGTGLVGLVYRGMTDDVNRYRRSLRRHTRRVIFNPIRTVYNGLFLMALFALLYLVAYRAEGLQALVAADDLTVFGVLSLFPPLPLLIPIVVAGILVTAVVDVLASVGRDMNHGQFR